MSLVHVRDEFQWHCAGVRVRESSRTIQSLSNRVVSVQTNVDEFFTPSGGDKIAKSKGHL